MNFMNRKAVGISSTGNTVKILAYGGSGSGKSRLGALMPNCLHLLLEAQGEDTVRQWSDDGTILVNVYKDDEEGTYTGTPNARIDDPKTRLKKIQHVLGAIHAGTVVEGGVRIAGYTVDKRSGEAVYLPVTDDCPIVSSLCADSLTEFQEIQLEALIGEKVGEVGEDQVSLPTWGILLKKTKAFIRQLRELPLDVLVLCLSDEKQEGLTTRYVPALYGNKLHPTISRYFTAVAWLVKRATGDGVKFEAVFEADSSKAVCKGCTGLSAVEDLPADPSLGGPAEWLKKIAESRPRMNPEIAVVKLAGKPAADVPPAPARRGRR